MDRVVFFSSGGTIPVDSSGLVSPVMFDQYYSYFAAAAECGAGRFALFTTAGNRCFASDDTAALRMKAMRWAGDGLPVYAHTHLHDLPVGEHYHRGRTKTARAAIGLFADIDARGPGRKKSLDLLCPTVADAVGVAERHRSAIAPLSLIIDSGYGCYAVCVFASPFVIRSSKDAAFLYSLSRRFHAGMAGIAAASGWRGAVDFCDPAKVIRVPGTVNLKDPANPLPVRIVAEYADRPSITELEAVLPVVESEFHEYRAARSFPAVGGRPLSVLLDLLFRYPGFANTWSFDRRDLRDTSCSAYDLAVACAAVAIGCTDDEVAKLLRENRRRFPGEKQDRRGTAYWSYLTRTIAKARAKHVGAGL